MKLRYSVIAFLLAGNLFAQTDPVLPRFMTFEEQALLKQLPVPGEFPQTGLVDPPPTPVRAMAEWEELQALLISWRTYPAILTEIVRAAREECRVIICCNNQSTVISATNTLTTAGVNLSSNVEFLIAPNNSIWIRDYGPNCVYANGVDSLYLVDWIYNRPSRPKDDTISTTIAPYLNVPLYATTSAPADLVNTGGNFMSDGLGTAFASKLILSENEAGNPYGVSAKNEVQINQVLSEYMGIERYIKMKELPYDAIHHIDMHMKLLDEETLLVGQYPPGVADGPQIEANLAFVLDNYQSVFGTPFKVIRVPMPPENGQYPNTNGDYRTYANAVFVNKTVIVPFYEEQFDTTAQRIWESALPGYHIVGIDCNAIIPDLGAIHCITKEIGVSDPLQIVHQELPCMDNVQWPDGYPVWANIAHRSGVESASIHYATDPAGPWQSVDMPVYLADDTSWTHKGFIPLQAANSTVYYYIEAKATSGKTITRPLPAPEGWWSFCVQESVGTENTAVAELLDIYPNPASAITVIPVSATAKTTGRISMYNALGQLAASVYQGEIPAGHTNYFIDASGFVPGAYFVQLQTGEQSLLKKLVIR